MTYRQVYKVTDNTLVITLPLGFKDRQVTVTIDDMLSAQKDKLALMQQAVQDPLYMADLNEVNEDFN